MNGEAESEEGGGRGLGKDIIGCSEEDSGRDQVNY